MSNYSTVETDKAVIRVYLTDGTMKSFLVTQSQTPNAVKFMVCKKLGLDVKEFNQFGLYVIEGESSGCSDVNENPFSLHVKWNAKSNSKSRFLFKRTDEVWPPKIEEAPMVSPHNAQSASGTPISSSGTTDTAYSYENSYQEDQDTGEDYDNGTPRDLPRGFGFGVTAAQIEAQKAAAAKRAATNGLSAKAQSRLGLIGWMNKSLEHLGLKISNLTIDMADGVVFFRLLELITHKTLKGWHDNPSNMMLKLDNLNMFLRILGYFGIKISGVSPEDIFSGNENIITAILLLMIKKYTPALQLEQYSDYATGNPQNDVSAEDDPDLMTPPSEPAPISSKILQEPSQTQSQPTKGADGEFETPPAEQAPLPPPGVRPASSKLPLAETNASSNSSVLSGTEVPKPTTTVEATPTLNSSPSSTPVAPRPVSGINPNMGRTGRVRSRMVTPEEQAAIAGAAYIARAPPKYTVDPSLTPDLSALLGPPVDMPLANGPRLSNVFPLLQTSVLGPAAPLQIPTQGPLGQTTSSPIVLDQSTPQLQKANSMPLTPQATPQAISTTTNVNATVQSQQPPLATAKSTGQLAGVKKVAAPSSPGSVKIMGPPGVKKVGSAIPGQNPAGTAKMGMGVGAAPKKSGVPSRIGSRPLPVPQPRSEPREEMDITFMPQDAVQDKTMPALEMDFSSPVPGSETASRTQRTRANTISNINTNVFDLDAFSDMEDLLLGLADGI